MAQTLAISKTITSMVELRQRFNMVFTEDEQFFTEWFDELPELTEQEQKTLDHLKQRFLTYRDRGPIPEGVVDKLLVTPLLDVAGFYDEPFTVRTEPQVEILLEDRDEILRGRIDTLIVQDRLWVLVLEAKRTIAFSVAIPQALAYMMATPHPEKSVFGVVTNGDEFTFIKASTQNSPQYDLSRVFSLLMRRNELYEVLRVMKKIGSSIA
ncbi:MAG: type I restriction endonuclease subunit R [Leptolyngbyaceae cyanobacterium RM2_2_4]|nr:type I restriction endonuclease subunit R [Leptolyngbyaceae cyanobacterium SM1_4_3]NJO53338.1 type I restriction endonuclease subunit R [Leptolyngbyaceae cyanobacterium RM2_2_4]